MTTTALPPVVDACTWQRRLGALRAREKAATRQLDATAAPRRRPPGWSSWTTTTPGSSSSPRAPIDEALAYKRRVGNKMTWYSTANSSFGSDAGAPPGGGFAVNAFLRDGDAVYRTWHANGRGTEQISYAFGLIDLLPHRRHEEWQDSPEGWPKSPTYSGWVSSQDVAELYGPGA